MARSLKVTIVGDAAQLEGALGRAGAATEAFGAKSEGLRGHLENAGKKMALFGAGVAVVGGELGKQFVEAGIAAQEQTGKLSAALEAQGQSYTKLQPQIENTMSSMRQLGFANSDTRDSLTKLVASGESVAKANRDMAVAADLARFKNVDLATATTALVKLHAGNTRSLKELGIVLPGVTSHVEALKLAHVTAATAAGAHALKVAALQDKLATASQGMQILTQRVHGQADEFSKSAAGGIQRFHAQLGNLEEKIGSGLLPIVVKLTSVLSDVVGWFQNLSPGMQSAIGYGAALAVGLGVLSAAIGAAIEVVATMTGVVGGLSTAMAFLAANPVVLIAAALVALGVALVEAYKHSATFRRIVQESMQAVQEVVGKLAHFVTVTIPNAFNAVLGWMKAHWPEIATIISGPFYPIVALATNAFGVRTALVNAFTAVASFISSSVSGAVRTLTSLFNTLVAAIKSIIVPALNILRGAFSAVAGALNTIESAARGAYDAVSKLVSLAKGAGHLIGGALGAVGLATGGIVTRPTLAVIGEAGPEAVVPLKGLQTGRTHFAPLLANVPASPAQVGAGAARAVVVNLLLPNYLGDRRQVAEQLRQELLKIGKANGTIFGGFA
jgi:phage-related protein